MKTTIVITWMDNNPRIKETDFQQMIGVALENAKLLGSVDSVKVTEASEVDGATLQARMEPDLLDRAVAITMAKMGKERGA